MADPGVTMPRDVWRAMLDLAQPRVTAEVAVEYEPRREYRGQAGAGAWTSSLNIEVISHIFGHSQTFSLANCHDYSLAKWEMLLAGGLDRFNAQGLPLRREGDAFVITRGPPYSEGLGTEGWDTTLRIPCIWLEAPLRAALAEATKKGLPFVMDG